MSEIASMLGHTEAETTKIYAHIHPDYQKGAVKALSDKYRRGKKEAKHFLSHSERKHLAEDKEEKA